MPLALPYPFLTKPGSGTWAERDKREVRKYIYILGGIRPSYSWILAYAELERKKHRGKHLFPSWHHFQSGFSFRPHHTFCMGTPRSVWLIVVSFRYRISRLNTFVRAFVVFQGGCSLPNDIITPSVRADFSS